MGLQVLVLDAQRGDVDDANQVGRALINGQGRVSNFSK